MLRCYEHRQRGEGAPTLQEWRRESSNFLSLAAPFSSPDDHPTGTSQTGASWPVFRCSEKRFSGAFTPVAVIVAVPHGLRSPRPGKPAITSLRRLGRLPVAARTVSRTTGRQRRPSDVTSPAPRLPQKIRTPESGAGPHPFPLPGFAPEQPADGVAHAVFMA